MHRMKIYLNMTEHCLLGIALWTSDIKDPVYVRAEGDFTNRIFHVTSPYNDLVHGRYVIKQ